MHTAPIQLASKHQLKPKEIWFAWYPVQVKMRCGGSAWRWMVHVERQHCSVCGWMYEQEWW